MLVEGWFGLTLDYFDDRKLSMVDKGNSLESDGFLIKEAPFHRVTGMYQNKFVKDFLNIRTHFDCCMVIFVVWVNVALDWHNGLFLFSRLLSEYGECVLNNEIHSLQ